MTGFENSCNMFRFVTYWKFDQFKASEKFATLPKFEITQITIA